MKEFIKIKNADGSGEMLLRPALIVAATDSKNEEGQAGTFITYVVDGGLVLYSSSASTAAEALEAIEGQRTQMMLEEYGAPTVRRQGGGDGMLEGLRGKGV